MSYNRDLECDPKAKQEYNALQKKLAAERLARNRAWNQAHKAK